MQLKILIVEDEPLIAYDLEEIIEEGGHKSIGICMDADCALKKLESEECDLALLDISLKGHLSGIDLARHIKKKIKIPFIFVTSYSDENTIDTVLSLNPAGYIVKPIQPKTLLSTIAIGYDNYSKQKEEKPSDENYIFIKDNSKLIKLNFSDILYAEAYDNYTYVHTNEKKYLINSTLKKVENKLKLHGFIRIHRSYLINLDRIKMVEENFVYLGNHHLTIGKTYRESVQKYFNRL